MLYSACRSNRNLKDMPAMSTVFNIISIQFLVCYQNAIR